MVPLDPSVRDGWGTICDAWLPCIEQAAIGVSTISLAGLTTYSLTVANNAPDQARYNQWVFTGALTSDCVVTIPGIARTGWATNATTGNHNIVLNGGAGSDLTMTPGHTYHWRSDGANVFADVMAFGSIAATTATFSGAITGLSAGFSGNVTAAGLIATGGVAASVVTSTGAIAAAGALTGGSASVAGVCGFGNTTCNVLGVNTTLNVSGNVGFNAALSVAGTCSAGSFVTTSDYRLKTTFGSADTGAMIDAIPIYDGERKDRPGVRMPLLLAHELAEAGAAFAVHGERDATDVTGDIVAQTVDYDSLVPALIAEVKALRRRVATLEAR